MFLKKVNSYMVPFVMASVAYFGGCEDSNSAARELINESSAEYNSIFNEVDYEVNQELDQGSVQSDSDLSGVESNMSYCGDNNIETTVRAQIDDLRKFLSLQYTRVDIDHPRDKIFKSTLEGRDFLVTYTPASREAFESPTGTGVINDYFLFFRFADEQRKFMSMGAKDDHGLSVSYYNQEKLSFSIDPSNLYADRFIVPPCGVYNQFYNFFIELNNQIGFNILSEQTVLESNEVVSGCLINSADKILNQYVSDVQEVKDVILESDEVIYSEYFDKELVFKDGSTYTKYSNYLNTKDIYRVCPLIPVSVDGVYLCRLYGIQNNFLSIHNLQLTVDNSGDSNPGKVSTLVESLEFDLNQNVAYLGYFNLFVPFHCEDDLLSLNSLLPLEEN